jgi:uncharacterized membrane protein YccC
LLLFSFKSFLAVALALLIGFSAGLPRPYWAVASVYVVAQPLTGALRSKAVFRLLGTVVGGCMAVLLVPPLVNAPELLSLALSVWVGLCLYLSLLDRTPRSYVFMLAGYTAAIIGFPSVNAPQVVFDTAVSRIEEIIIGILCATLVHSVLFPRDVGPLLDARVQDFLRDARAWIVDALTGQMGMREWHKRHRVATDLTELQMLSIHLPFDTEALASRTHAMGALQDRLAILLPLIASIDDRLAALRKANANAGVLSDSLQGSPPDSLSGSLRFCVDEVITFVQTPSASRADAQQLKSRLTAALPVMEAKGEDLWAAMLTTNAIVRLREIVDCWQESLELAVFLHDPGSGLPPHLGPLVRDRARRRLHADHHRAILSALAMTTAVLGCCTFWITTGWQQGAVAALMAAIFASSHASQNNPGASLMTFVRWTAVSLPIAWMYLFLILPRISDFPLLLLVLAPFYLVVGYIQGNPKQTPRAMPLIFGVTGVLALQETFSANFESFINGGLAQIIGVGAAMVAMRILRTVDSTLSVQRILKQGRLDLAALAAGRMDADRAAWISLMLDRLGLIAPHLAMDAPDEQTSGTHDAMADLRVGLNIIALRQIDGERAVPDLSALLDAVAARYRNGRAVAPEPVLLARIDAQLGAALQRGAQQYQAARFIGALTGLRRIMFPDAPVFAMKVE